MKYAYHEKFKRIQELKRSKAVNSEPIDETPASVKLFMEQQTKTEPDKGEDGDNLKDAHVSKTEFLRRLSSIQWDMSSLIKKSRNRNVDDFQEDSEERTEKARKAAENLSWEGFAEEVVLEDLKYKERKHKVTVKTTTDPSLPISDIPCNGCGAFLHCQDYAIAGFLPSEKFKTTSVSELSETFCQRCSMIRNHNMHLKVDMPEDTFLKLFARIKNDRKCLVVLLVDLLDIPNSINKNLLEWVGKNQQFYVIGNKVDLIPNDGIGYLERVEEAVYAACFSSGFTERNIRHMALVSGKTGYGIERLITKLLHDWERQGYSFDLLLMQFIMI